MIGVLADKIIGTPQYHFMFKALNELSKTQDVYLFVSEVKQLPRENKFAIMQQVEALHHPGVLIGTSMLNTQIVANCLTATRKFYYISHFEWMYLTKFGAHQLDNIFYNDEIELIAGSTSHANLLSKLFKPPAGIVYNWDKGSLEKVIL